MSWYRQWFDNELYMDLYAHRDDGEAQQAIDLFEQRTGPVRGRRCLDLACGTGRHAIELARRGASVLAADLSATLLEAARPGMRRFPDTLQLLRADMRRIPVPPRSFDAVLQLFTAFGYFPRDQENARVIGGVRGTLRDGGWYLLDFLNAAQVRATLVPRSEQETGGVRIVQHRRLTETRVEKRICVERNGTEQVFEESVRLFTLDDFQRMFQENGFAMETVAGDYDGSAFTADSPRCLMFARAVR
jgi:ubiquinone/menaquinone biosynthesis C-methylase UbiE